MSWLTYSGRFTHISGHPSAVGRAQDSESSPVKDQRSTAEPRDQINTMQGQGKDCGLTTQVKNFNNKLHCYRLTVQCSVLITNIIMHKI